VRFLITLLLLIGWFSGICQWDQQIHGLRQKATHFLNQGKEDSALVIVQEILEYFQDVSSNPNAVFKTQLQEGLIYNSLEAYQPADQSFTKCLTLIDSGEIHDTNKLALYKHLIYFYAARGDTERMRGYADLSIPLITKSKGPNSFELAEIYTDLGNYHLREQAFEKAVDMFQKSFEIRKSIKDPPIHLGRNLVNLGQSHLRLGHQHLAEKQFQVAISYFEMATEDAAIDITVALNHLGHLSGRKGDLDRQQQYYQQALDKRIQFYGPRHSRVADNYRFLSFVAGQMQKFKDQIDLAESGISALLPIDENNEIQDPVIYLKLMREKIDGYRELSRECEERSNLDHALLSIKISIDFLETQKTYFADESKSNIYRQFHFFFEEGVKTAFKLYELTNETSYALEAFFIADRSKNTVLHDAVSLWHSLSDKKLENELMESKELRYKISKLINEGDIDGLDDELFSMQEKWRLNVRSVRDETDNILSSDSLKFELIQQKLIRNNQILQEYFESEDAFFVFTISGNNISFRRVSKTPEIKNALCLIEKSISNYDFIIDSFEQSIQIIQEQGHRIWKDLVAIENFPSREKNLIFIPSKSLVRIPFEALPVLSVSSSISEIPFAVLSYNISYAPSAEIYQSLTRSKNANCNYIGFAPEYSGVWADQYTVLPSNKMEINRVASTTAGESYIGDQATEEAFWRHLEKIGILHLALHTDRDSLGRHRLILNPSSAHDGFIQVYELQQLWLSLQLTYLNACYSAGDSENGHGIYGLHEAFTSTGCPSTIANIWTLDDQAGAELAGVFFELLKGGIHLDQALSGAKIAWLNDADPLHAHPYFWSSTILFGDRTPLYPERQREFSILLMAGAPFCLLLLLLILHLNPLGLILPDRH